MLICVVAADCRKGISRSALPYRRTAPSWCKASSEQVVEDIKKYAKKGMTPSQIGVVLRDSMGIAQVWCRFVSHRFIVSCMFVFIPILFCS